VPEQVLPPRDDAVANVPVPRTRLGRREIRVAARQGPAPDLVTTTTSTSPERPRVDLASTRERTRRTPPALPIQFWGYSLQQILNLIHTSIFSSVRNSSMEFCGARPPSPNGSFRKVMARDSHQTDLLRRRSQVMLLLLYL
jgi:hypothetical protein